MVHAQDCFRQSCPPFQMAAVTRNRNFFYFPLLTVLYIRSQQIFRNFLWKFLLRPIYTDYSNKAYFDKKKNQINLAFKIIFFFSFYYSETTQENEIKLVYDDLWLVQFCSYLCMTVPSTNFVEYVAVGGH